MKILIRKTDGVVIYAQDDLQLDTEAHGNGWRDPNFSTDNATLDDSPLPGLWAGAVWSYIGGVWAVVDTARHADIKAIAALSAWERIKAKRDKLSESGGYVVTVAGTPRWFHSDAKSKTQQLSLVMMGAAVPPVGWKTMNGVKVTMTQALAGQIFQAAAAQDMALFAAADTHRTAMEASADPSAYNFSSGWPATYTVEA